VKNFSLRNGVSLLLSLQFSKHSCIGGIIFIIVFSSLQQSTIGTTYKDLWWLGYSESSPPEQSAANLRVYYTYPDRVYKGQNFNFGITLE
jgi:hypothetical protein